MVNFPKIFLILTLLGVFGNVQAFDLRVLSLKFVTSDHVLMINFELSGVDNPYKHVIRTKFTVFEKSKNNYVYVLNFFQEWF